MKIKKWTDDEVKQLLEMRAEGKTMKKGKE